MKKPRVRVDESWRDQPEEALPPPPWVFRWKRARAVGDFRVFPEQIPGYLSLGLEGDLPAAPMTDPEFWVQPHQHVTT